MALYWSPCIVVGAVRYYLPPWIAVRDTWGQSVEVLRPPYGTRPIIAEVYDNEPVSLTLEAVGIASGTAKARNVLDWMAELRAQLRGRTFSLYLFNDRGYEVCALTSNAQQIPLGRLAYIDTTIDLVSETSSDTELPTLDFPNGYDIDYPYASLVGRPDGEASSGGGISVIQAPRQTPGGIFPGNLYEVTGSGNEHRYIVGGGVGSVWTLEQFQITSAGIDDASGNTTLVVSTAPIGSSGPSLSSTIDATQKFSNASTGAISVTAGATLYVYASAAGGHGAVQYSFQLKG